MSYLRNEATEKVFRVLRKIDKEQSLLKGKIHFSNKYLKEPKEKTSSSVTPHSSENYTSSHEHDDQNDKDDGEIASNSDESYYSDSLEPNSRKSNSVQKSLMKFTKDFSSKIIQDSSHNESTLDQFT